MEKIFTFQKSDISNKAISYLEKGVEIIVPLCPDYIPGAVGDGVSKLMYTALDVAGEIRIKYPNNTFTFLIADTEGDITELNRGNIVRSQKLFQTEILHKMLPGNVHLFMDHFPNWHIKQYTLEERIKSNIAADVALDRFLSLNSFKRQERYSQMYARDFSPEDTRAMQIRHYAQYMLLRTIMEEKGLPVLMNYQTENLRAVTKFHEFCPHRIRTEVLVY